MKIENAHLLSHEPQPECVALRRQKYNLDHETTEDEIFVRVADGLGRDKKQARKFLSAMRRGFVGAGRINRSIGAGNKTTAINCFVQPVGDSIDGPDEDGLPSIMDALKKAAITLQKGGGVGYDFSPIRPLNARVKGTGSRASGPLSYMRVYNEMCATLESAGERRGAQMAILRVDHPDVMQFIDCKRMPNFEEMGLPPDEAARLMALPKKYKNFAWPFRKAFGSFHNFNMSVAVTDEFMQAVLADAEFDLVHKASPDADNPSTKVCSDGVTRYVYKTVRALDVWNKIMKNTYEGAEPGLVFIDRIQADNNLGYCEVISATNPCGEQPLPAYGCCDLGSIFLMRCVRNMFTKEAFFDFDLFKELIHTGVELLDRVLDVTLWPQPEQQVEAMNKRRIGLNYSALADAMAMLGIPYNSVAGAEFAAKVTEFMRDEAYLASVELSKLYGPFPLFNADEYLKPGTFASRLPQHIQDAIREHGIHNSHLLTIPPAGTISMCFADNCSSGVEPIFAREQIRNIIGSDGQRQTVGMLNASYRMYKQMFGAEPPVELFPEAQEMSVDDHLRVLQAVAPFIDSSISKTVNVPVDYPYEDFQDVYMRAWKGKLKGITTYRKNDILGSVIEDANATNALKTDDPDRRVEIKDVQQITQALKWPKRPVVPQGTPSTTYSVRHPHGNFAVVVGHYVNGRRHPLEVYISGTEQPRGLASLAKVLSVDMRTGDSAWLKMKLDTLANTEADDAFEMLDPYTGNSVRASSLVSGFARYVEHALTCIDALTETGESKMVDALFSKREPKTGPAGSLSWGVDVRNYVTGDDFLMTTKEVRLPDGTVRPYSVWLSGRYPRVLDGLTKLLSIDMRVSDPAWAVMKLRSLLTFGEQRGDFLADVPGGEGQHNYPSTVAYMAALLLERYRVLGLIKEDLPLAAEVKDAPKVEDTPVGVGTGMFCPNCHTMSMHKQDGCQVCSNCGHMGHCG